jgi:carbamoyl-phosphate synthase large subunit
MLVDVSRMLTVLVTGAGGNIGATMTRGLHEWDRTVRIVGTEVSKYYRFLSGADETYRVPPASDEAYFDRLSEIVKAESVDVVLPSNGWEVNALSQRPDAVPAATALPDGDSVDLFQDKWELSQALEQTDIPKPESVLVEEPSDVGAAVDAVSTEDVWVRGIGIKDYPGRKMRHQDRIVDWIDYNDGWGTSTISAYLGGTDLTWLGVYDEGTLVCSQGRQRLDYGESQSWGTGAPTVSRSIHRDDLNELGRRSIEAVDDDPNGVYFSDFRADEDGVPHLTEVNPGRLGTTSSAFYLRTGLNLTALLVQIALGEKYDAPPTFDALPADLHYISKASCDPVIVTGTEIESDGFES